MSKESAFYTVEPPKKRWLPARWRMIALVLLAVGSGLLIAVSHSNAQISGSFSGRVEDDSGEVTLHIEQIGSRLGGTGWVTQDGPSQRIRLAGRISGQDVDVGGSTPTGGIFRFQGKVTADHRMAGTGYFPGSSQARPLTLARDKP